MVVEMNLSVLREHRLEISVIERVRMRSAGPENHQIRDVYHAHTEVWYVFAQECRGCNYLKGDFYTDTDKDAMGRDG
jgi:hypothetical protein